MASIVALPEVPVTVTEHLPAFNAHVLEENVMVPLPETFDQVMVPVCEGYPPATVAVQVIFVLMAHNMVVCVVAFVMVSTVGPELIWLFVSPR